MLVDSYRLTGTVVDGAYRLDHVVGEGSYGLVYHGLSLQQMTPIAFKVLRMPPHLSAVARERLLAKFDEEAESLIELSERHPAFVRVLERGVLPGSVAPNAPYLVMEWLDGETLEAELARRQATRAPGRTLDETINLLTPIAEALELAHLERVVHRNLTPSDVFLVDVHESVKAKLLDLGLSRMMTAIASVAPSAAPESELRAFSMRYGAPEQWNRSYGVTGAWTDVYALALICVEMMTGKPALQGEEASQFLGATIDPSDRPTPQSRGLRVPIAVELVFRTALAVVPKNRYPNAGLFWDALCDAAGSRALGPKSSQRSKSPASLAPQPPTSKPQPALSIAPQTVAPTVPRRRWSRWMFAAVCAVVPLSALAVVLRGPPEQGASVLVSAAPVASTLEVIATASASPEPAPSALAAARGPFPERMVALSGGTLRMGSADYADEKPVHEVTLLPFCLDEGEVTAGDYAACVARGACKAAEPKSPNCNGARGDKQDHPMNCVDWARTEAYCRAQQKKLPTEEQWEYAARGPERRTFPWGEKDPDAQLCWNQWSGGSPLGTCVVGSHPEGDTRTGLHDLAGNVWEWTDTWHCLDYSGKSCPKKVHVVRGGGWSIGLPLFVRSAYRGGPAQASGGDDVGFRCAKAL